MNKTTDIIQGKGKGILLGLCTALALTASGQDALRSGYFSEGYYNRHELNPAFAPERNYVTIPGLGGLNQSLTSNVGLSTFIYPITIDGQDKLTTFMNPDISASEFLGKLKSNNRIAEDLRVPILGIGFRALGGYNTIGINVTAGINLGLPKDLFTFAKLGMTSDDTKYNFKNLGASANARAELVLGHSRQILPQLRVGAKVKLLFGVFNAQANVDNFEARLSNDVWSINAVGSMHLSGGSGLMVPTKIQNDPSVDPAQANLIDYGGIKYDSFSLAGFGMGFDLGAVYQLTPDLELSASLRDLGFMSWNNTLTGVTPNVTWQFDGFKDIALDKDDPNYEENKLGEQLDKLGDDLQDCLEFRLEDGRSTRVTGLAATFMLGAQYTMPFYRGLRGGFLYTQRINGAYSWSEGRLSANVAPIGWFDAAINYGISNFGSSLGWIINFHPCGVNFFIGADYQFFKVNPQMVPIGNANLAMSLGFNFTFGGKKKQALSPLMSSSFQLL